MSIGVQSFFESEVAAVNRRQTTAEVEAALTRMREADFPTINVVINYKTMNNNQNQPNQYDAVLGGNAPPPIYGAVLGGIEGVKRRLASSNFDVQIAALNDALNYGDVGLDTLIKTLQHDSAKTRKYAYKLLQDKEEIQVKQALKDYKFWTSFEKTYEFSTNHTTTFANRKVKAAIQTNLSCNLDWVEDCNKESLALWATFHPEWVSRQSYLSQCLELDKRKVRFSAGVVGFPQYKNEIAALRQELPSHVRVPFNLTI